MGQLQKLVDAKTGANELSIEFEAKINSKFWYVAYNRTQVDAITLRVTLKAPIGDIIIREVVASTDKNWYFNEPTPLMRGDKIKFETVGAGASENHKARMVIEEG